MDLCDICKAIPYDRLPSEENPGYPHQPSLDALTASATKCQLCKFILEAVDDLKKLIEDEKNGKPRNGWILFDPDGSETLFGPVVSHNINTTPNQAFLVLTH
jgi:hypothetical protein